MYSIYGIVKIEKSSNNKRFIVVSVSHIFTLIPPKCAKKREPEDKHCGLQYSRE